VPLYVFGPEDGRTNLLSNVDDDDDDNSDDNNNNNNKFII